MQKFQLLLLLIAAAAYVPQVSCNCSFLISEMERLLFEHIEEKSHNYDYFRVFMGDNIIQIPPDVSDDGTQKSVTQGRWGNWGFIPEGSQQQEDIIYLREVEGYHYPYNLSKIERLANGRSIQYQFIDYCFENGTPQPLKVVKFVRIRYAVQPCSSPEQCSFKLKISSIRELISQFTIESTADKVEIFRRIKAAVP